MKWLAGAGLEGLAASTVRCVWASNPQVKRFRTFHPPTQMGWIVDSLVEAVFRGMK